MKKSQLYQTEKFIQHSLFSRPVGYFETELRKRKGLKYNGTSPLRHFYSRDTFIQGTQTLVPVKRPHNLCISVEGTPVFRGHFFWVPKPKFNLHSGDTIARKKWLTTKRVDIFKCALITNVEAFTKWTFSLKSVKCFSVNSTYYVAGIS